MKSLLLLIALLISTSVFCQKIYKPLFPKDNQVSCVIVKSQELNTPNLKLQNFSHDKDNKLKFAASAGIVGFAGIMTVNYCTSTDEKFKQDRLGYWSLMGALAAGLITVQIVL